MAIKDSKTFRFRKYLTCDSLNPNSNLQVDLAVPDEDMHNVSPFPDFDDVEKVQQYIQDRRVIGVCIHISHFNFCSHEFPS